MGLEAVFFDVGNTLFYLDYSRLVATLRLDVSPDAAALAERRARPRLSDWLREKRASTENPESFKRYLALALEGLPPPGLPPQAEGRDSRFERLCAEHRRANFFCVPAPGALEALERLSVRFKLAVVSNAGGKVAAKLEKTGFSRHLLRVLDSALEKVEKPDPRIFLAACERAGVEPGRTVYVGDLHSIDVLGARAAGLGALLLDPAGAYAERGVADCTLVADVAHAARHLLDSTSRDAW